MHDVTNLPNYLNKKSRHHGQIDEDLAGIIMDMARACKIISHMVGRGALADVLGYAESENVQGETQAKLDVLANDVILRAHEASGHVAAMASEEMESIYSLPIGSQLGDYLLVFDPLDGSSNIDVNASIGTIFGVLPVPRGINEPREQHFLQPGDNLVAAGYVVYGPSTVLVLTLGDGVDVFTLDRSIGEFTLVRQGVRLPPETGEYSINSANSRFWEPAVRRYIDECVAGKDGARGKNFTMRWIGSMVADCHRVLSRGGVFMYPKDNRDPNKPGKLRLLYEVNPMAMLAEQAGGKASTGYGRVLAVEPSKLHQRVGLLMGSSAEVERLERYHQENA